MQEMGALPPSSSQSSVGDKPVSQTQYSASGAKEGAWKQRGSAGDWEGFPEKMMLELGFQGQRELD